jgi:hypothetical protein
MTEEEYQQEILSLYVDAQEKFYESMEYCGEEFAFCNHQQ